MDTDKNTADAGRVVSYGAVQQALMACMRRDNANGLRHDLSKDASLIAEVFGRMNYYGETALDVGQLSEPQAEALKRAFAALSDKAPV